MTTDLTTYRAKIQDGMGLDIRALARGKYLRTGIDYARSLIVDGRRRMVRHLMVDETHMHLWSEVHLGQTVEVARTAGTYGGERVWFVCPDCGRNCAILYSPLLDFTCRICAGLYHGTSTMGRYGRAVAKAENLRKRLGWSPSIVDDEGPRPQGMHDRTFWRLRLEYWRAATIACAEIARRSKMPFVADAEFLEWLGIRTRVPVVAPQHAREAALNMALAAGKKRIRRKP